MRHTDGSGLDHVTDGESLDRLVLGRASRAVGATDGLDVAAALLVTSAVENASRSAFFFSFPSLERTTMFGVQPRRIYRIINRSAETISGSRTAAIQRKKVVLLVRPLLRHLDGVVLRPVRQGRKSLERGCRGLPMLSMSEVDGRRLAGRRFVGGSPRP